MSKLANFQPNAAVRRILPDALVTVLTVQWFGLEAPAGRVANELPYPHDEPRGFGLPPTACEGSFKGSRQP